MLKDIIEVKVKPDFKIWVRFEDEVSGTFDFGSLVGFKGVFAALEKPDEFAKLSVNPELGVICWPNGADLDSDVIYSVLTNKPILLDQSASLPA
jgi:hypothetical protein